MTEQKTITGWLVVDWRSGNHRTRKSKPSASDLGSNELLAKLEVNVTVPEVDVPTLAVDIDAPEPQVFAATMEALSEDELPDWTDVVSEVVHEAGSEIEAAADDPEALQRVVEQLTARTLVRVNSRPKPEQVQDYVAEVVRRVRDGGEEVLNDA